MSDEEYLRNRLDRLNQNSHYGIMIDTEITDIVRSHIKRLEEMKMKATSTETFHDIIAVDFELQTFPNPDVEDKFIVSATNRDDIFCFVFEGPNLRDACRNAGLFVGWEKDQKIKELEKELKISKDQTKFVGWEKDQKIKELEKELKISKDQTNRLDKENDWLRKNYMTVAKDEEIKEKNRKINDLHHKLHEAGIEKRRLEGELGRWKKEAADCLKLRDEAQKEAYKLKKENEKLKKENEDLKKHTVAKALEYIEINNKLQDENEELKYQLRDIQATKEVVEKKLNTRDNVNHPSHYTGRYECIDVMQDVFGDEATNDFCLCNAFKYIWRANKKNGLEDVKKAVWYLNKYIEEAEKDGVPKGK